MRNLLVGIPAAIALFASSLASAHGPVRVASVFRAPNLGLYANGWDAAYRNPFGAAPTDSRVTLSLRSAAFVTSVIVYLQTQSGATTRYPLRRARPAHNVDTWSIAVRMPHKAQVMSYYFRAQAGKTVRWYGDNSGVGEGGPGQTYQHEGDVLSYSLTVYLKSFHTPGWMSKAVIYQIFPDRFYDGNKANDPKTGTVHGYITVYFHKHWSDTPFDGPPYSNDFFGGDLRGVIDKLGYLHGLGINAIYLNPIFTAPSDHKYDTSNFFQIDPEFGTLKTFQILVADAKKLGIRLILDGVFEDTGTDSVYFNQYNEFHDLGAYQSKKSPYFSWYSFQYWPTVYSDWMGVSTLALLNENPSVENFFFRKPGSVAQYWLSQGTGGWRLDSADTLSENYWRAFRSTIKARYPDSVIIGEKNGWQDALPWLMGDQWDGMMNYQFRDPVLEFFANGIGAQTAVPISASVFLASEMGLLAEYPRPALLSSMNLVDSHDTARILNDLNFNKQALRLVALYQMTWLGAPTIFYGDEAGVTGTDNNTGRATFPWGHDDKSLEAYYRSLIHMRLKYPAFTEGSVQPVLTSNGQRVVAFLRTFGRQHIVVALNDSDRTQTVTLPLGVLRNGTTMTDLLSGGQKLKVQGGSIRLAIPKLAGRVLLAGK